MTAMVRIPARETMQAAILERAGLGWRLGVGRIVTGRIDRLVSCHLSEREAEKAAFDLADRDDLILVWSEGESDEDLR